MGISREWIKPTWKKCTFFGTGTKELNPSEERGEALQTKSKILGDINHIIECEAGLLLPLIESLTILSDRIEHNTSLPPTNPCMLPHRHDWGKTGLLSVLFSFLLL